MKDFAQHALVLFSDKAKYLDSYGGYKQSYLKALANLTVALSNNDIRMLCLCSDPLAVNLWREVEFDADWQDVDDIGGMYFIHNNSDTPNFERSVSIPDNIRELLDRRIPIERGITPERRAFLMNKRVAIAEKELIRQNKLVFVFGSAYRAYQKEDDGRACVLINNQFIPTLKLSGHDSPIAAFMGFPTANLALTDWRF